MEVEFTARQVKIAKVVRDRAEEGLERLARIVGKTAIASVIFSAQKLDQCVELTVQARTGKLVARVKSSTQAGAMKEALERIEAQALRHRDRRLEVKRLPREEKVVEAPPVARSRVRGAANEEKPAKVKSRVRKTIVVKAHPSRPAVVEPHILTAAEAFAEHPLTIEEAVKETEAEDRDLLIFHDPEGDLFVLHRRRDGEMELVGVS
jgi:putative sigma-54 modulation protein